MVTYQRGDWVKDGHQNYISLGSPYHPMKARSLVVLAVLILLSHPAAAQSMAEQAQAGMGQFNALDESDRLAQFVRENFGNEVVAIEIGDTGEAFTISVEDGKITGVSEGISEEATFVVSTNMSTIESIAGSEDPVGSFLETINTGGISYETTEKASFKTKLMVFLSKLAAKILGLVKSVLARLG